MSTEKEQLTAYLSWYEDIEWKALERDELGVSGNLKDATETLTRIRRLFDFLVSGLKNQKISNRIGPKTIGWFQRLKVLIDTIATFSDVRQRRDMLEKVYDFEYELMAGTDRIFPYIEFQNKVSSTADIPPATDPNQIVNQAVDAVISRIKNFRDIEGTVAELVVSKDTLQQAVSSAKNWLESNAAIIDTAIKQNVKDSAKKAREHNSLTVTYVDNPIVTVWGTIPILGWLLRQMAGVACTVFPPFKHLAKQPSFTGTFIWLIAAGFFGTIVFVLLGYFVHLNQPLSIAESILRVAIVLVPSYFTLVCVQQYLIHRRLYEAYMFKDIALNTMVTLRGQMSNSTSGLEAQRLILEKGLKVLFSEPSMSNEVKFDKVLVKEVLELLRKNN